MGKEAALHDHTDTHVNIFGVCDWLANKVGIFNAVGDVEDELLYSIVGVPVRFHLVLVQCVVVFVCLALVFKKSMKHIAEAQVGIVNVVGYKFLGAKRRHKGKKLFSKCFVHVFALD